MAVQMFCQCVDAGVTHAAQFGQQFKAFGGQVFEKLWKVVEIEPLDRLIRQPAVVNTPGQLF
jgi:hypothetical protein